MSDTLTPLPCVQYGLYRYFTRPQMDAEKAKYVAAVQGQTQQRADAGGQMISAAGGASFHLPDGISSLEEWGDIISQAYDQLAGGQVPPNDRAVYRAPWTPPLPGLAPLSAAGF